MSYFFNFVFQFIGLADLVEPFNSTLMKLNDSVINLLSQKIKMDVSTPHGADFLRNDIEAQTGERLSLNTVKRLVGLLPYSSDPRLSTREIIAGYLGFGNWAQLCEHINDKISDFGTPEGFIYLKKLPLGMELLISWNPGRELKIRHIGEGRYIVGEASNSKILKDDILSLSQIAVGFPLMAKEVIREGKSLGNYTAASTEGLSKIRIITD